MEAIRINFGGKVFIGESLEVPGLLQNALKAIIYVFNDGVNGFERRIKTGQ